MKNTSDPYAPAMRAAPGSGEAQRAAGFVRFDLAEGGPAAPGGSGRGGASPLAALGASSGFRRDSRYIHGAEDHHPQAQSEAVPDGDDLAAQAYAEGFDAGMAEAFARAEEKARADAQARDALALSFVRLDAELEEALRLRLRDTVAALCESALAPLALDTDLLMRRISRAVSMLARADDERVIRLNPADLELVSARLVADWNVVPDPGLERGALRVECETGGVADGPEAWRQVIAEALQQC